MHKIRSSRYRDIPWNLLNVSKMLVVFLLLCGSGIDLGMVAISEEDIPNVEPVTKAFNFVSYVSLQWSFVTVHEE